MPLTGMIHFEVTAKQKFYLTSPLMVLRYKGYDTNGIIAQVEALGPTWAECKVNKFR